MKSRKIVISVYRQEDIDCMNIVKVLLEDKFEHPVTDAFVITYMLHTTKRNLEWEAYWKNWRAYEEEARIERNQV